MALDTWIRVPHPRPHARQRLYCMPHAGGGASFYRSWGAAAPDWLEVAIVQYPGREERIGEPPAASLDALAKAIAASVTRFGGRPALFGHSLGAMVAHRVAHELDGDIEALFVSACPPPEGQRPTRHHLLDDDGLERVVRAHGGTPDEVFADPTLRELVLAIMREDYRLVETHVEPASPPLAAPITAFAPTVDPSVSPPEMARWRSRTTADFDLVELPGGHFAIVEERDRVLRTIGEELRHGAHV